MLVEVVIKENRVHGLVDELNLLQEGKTIRRRQSILERGVYSANVLAQDDIEVNDEFVLVGEVAAEDIDDLLKS